MFKKLILATVFISAFSRADEGEIFPHGQKWKVDTGVMGEFLAYSPTTKYLAKDYTVGYRVNSAMEVYAEFETGWVFTCKDAPKKSFKYVNGKKINFEVVCWDNIKTFIFKPASGEDWRYIYELFKNSNKVKIGGVEISAKGFKDALQLEKSFLGV